MSVMHGELIGPMGPDGDAFAAMCPCACDRCGQPITGDDIWFQEITPPDLDGPALHERCLVG